LFLLGKRIISLSCEFFNIDKKQRITEMLFDTCQRLGGHVWYSVVRDLIIERWQTIFPIRAPYDTTIILDVL
jgi:hypothetical protein